jgi:hypothetical protein
MIYPRGSIACRQPTSSVWRHTHLVAHALIGITRLALHKGVIKKPIQERVFNAMSNPLEFFLLWIFRGEGTRTPHNHHDWSRRQSPPSAQQFYCTKPSRCWQPPRVTRIPQLDYTITSGTRCSNFKQMHYGSLTISLGWWINEGDEWEVFHKTHKGVSMFHNPKRVSKSRPTHFYRAPKAQVAVTPRCAFHGGIGQEYCSH